MVIHVDSSQFTEPHGLVLLHNCLGISVVFLGDPKWYFGRLLWHFILIYVGITHVSEMFFIHSASLLDFWRFLNMENVLLLFFNSFNNPISWV